LENSFRAEGVGNYFILDVSYDSNTQVVVPPVIEDEEVLTSESQKKEYQQRLNEISIEMKTIETERTRMNAEKNWCHEYMSLFTNKQSKGQQFVKVEEAATLLKFYHSNLERFDNVTKDLDIRAKALEKESTELRNIINYMPAPKKPPTVVTTRRVNVIICPKFEEVITLQLSYIIYGASWSSSYDFRVTYASETDNGCSLVFYGNIINSTGEDWKNVSVELSTAAPSIGGVPPVLQPVKISAFPIIQSTPRSKSQAKSKKMTSKVNTNSMMKNESYSMEREELSTSGGSSEEKKERFRPPTLQIDSKVENKGTSVNYKISNLVNIEADNKPHKISISKIVLESVFDYVIVPILTKDAYLRALTTNSSNFQFLEGPMNVFINNYFITTSSLGNINPNEQFTLYLGIDRTIVVDLKPLAKNNKQQGLIKKTSFLDEDRRVVITNTKSEPIKICVFMQLPFSQDNTIKVKLEEPNLKEEDTPATIDEFSIVQWKYELAPGDEVKVRLHYTVEYNLDSKLNFTNQNHGKTSY